jgi:hypothetical protein
MGIKSDTLSRAAGKKREERGIGNGKRASSGWDIHDTPSD